MIKILFHLPTYLFGKAVYTKNSKGKLWHGRYLVLSGKVDIGDIVFFS